MEIGEFTLVDLILTAFSGFGLLLFGWIFGKKIIGRVRSKDKQSVINQHDNITQGDMAGGDIIKTNNGDRIDSKRTATKVNQTGNKVGGDMAGGNIVKRNKDE